ncbi:site-2 protease family protein [Candidatus Woesebacteria bacterium]|nr:site-2 protease family protein [Candidatus Woesebacteria bacterium]
MIIIFWLLAFAVAITIHEASHALMADRLGDPTPRLEGRLSLNPLVHYDPIGTTLLFALVLLRALGAPVIPFGWAKPVRFDPYNLQKPRRDAALISTAGPLANIALATFLSLLIRVTSGPFSPVPQLYLILYPSVVLNVALAIFNLIPIHPLDGGKILVGLLPYNESREVDHFLNRYGMILLLFTLFPLVGGNSIMSLVISPIISFVINILAPGTQFI